LSRGGALVTLQYLHRLVDDYRVGWISHEEKWINSTMPFSDAIIGFMGEIAKQERLRLSQRVKIGLDRVKKDGQRLGRRPKTLDIDRARAMLSARASLRSVAKYFGVSHSTLLAHLKGGNRE
jgi:DNA invertase Pin-like site-specific DNA recombinase